MKFDAAQCLVESYSIWIMQKDTAGDEDQFARKIERKEKLLSPKNRTWIDESGAKPVKRSMPPIITKGTESRGGRTSTTYRVANLIEAGHIIAAAEHNPARRFNPIMWGEFAYRENNDFEKANREKELARFILNRYVTTLDRRPEKKIRAYTILARLAVIDYRHRALGKRQMLSNGYIAKTIGVSIQAYSNNYKKHFDVMISIIERKLDKPLLDPVRHAIREMNWVEPVDSINDTNKALYVN